MKSWLVVDGVATLYDEGLATSTKVQMTLQGVGAGLKKAQAMGQPIVVALWPGLALFFPTGPGEPSEEEKECGARKALFPGFAHFYCCPEGCFMKWEVVKKPPAATVLQNRQAARQEASKTIKAATATINVREATKADFAAMVAEIPDYPDIQEGPEDYGF